MMHITFSMHSKCFLMHFADSYSLASLFRKFSTSHLAQIKYLLPEAVQIDKILMHDDNTKCMKSEMKIELLFDVVKYHNEESVYVALSNIFSSRLRDFYARHPEVIINAFLLIDYFFY